MYYDSLEHVQPLVPFLLQCVLKQCLHCLLTSWNHRYSLRYEKQLTRWCSYDLCPNRFLVTYSWYSPLVSNKLISLFTNFYTSRKRKLYSASIFKILECFTWQHTDHYSCSFLFTCHQFFLDRPYVFRRRMKLQVLVPLSSRFACLGHHSTSSLWGNHPKISTHCADCEGLVASVVRSKTQRCDKVARCDFGVVQNSYRIRKKKDRGEERREGRSSNFRGWRWKCYKARPTSDCSSPHPTAVHLRLGLLRSTDPSLSQSPRTKASFVLLSHRHLFSFVRHRGDCPLDISWECLLIVSSKYVRTWRLFSSRSSQLLYELTPGPALSVLEYLMARPDVSYSTLDIFITSTLRPIWRRCRKLLACNITTIMLIYLSKAATRTFSVILPFRSIIHHERKFDANEIKMKLPRSFHLHLL